MAGKMTIIIASTRISAKPKSRQDGARKVAACCMQFAHELILTWSFGKCF
jgi:hypothetical protein